MREGILLNKSPSPISKNGGDKTSSVKIVLNQISGATVGKKYYQVRRPDDSILLIPEDNFVLAEYQ